MSDYLWDGTGEADAEVERLEGLLRVFGHTPRMLEMPEDALPQVSSHRPRLFGAARLFRAPPRRFGWAKLATATTALLLVLLLGAVAFIRTRTATTNDGHQEVASGNTQTSRPSQDEPPREASQARRDSTLMRKGIEPEPFEPKAASARELKNDGRVVARKLKTERRGEQLASLQNRRRTSAHDVSRVEPVEERGHIEAMSASSGVGVASSLFDNTRLMAKEQLIYALRLTGAKLKEVQRKTKGLEDSKSVRDTRQPIR
jgi:hypothetical protein